MVVSWKDAAKFVAFALIVALVVVFVVTNRQHLTDGLNVGSGGQPAEVVTSGGTADTGATGADTAGVPGEIISVGAFDDNSLTGSSLGAAAQPGTGVAGSSDLFVEFRLQREQARSEQLDLLREVLNNANVDEKARSDAMNLWLKITQDIAAEVDIENLIRAKGFADAVVVLSQGKATVMVKTASLTRDEVLRVADLVVRVAGVPFEDITVMARGG